MSSTLFGALSSKDKLQQSITSLSKQIGTLTTTTENLSWKKRVCRPTDWADVTDTLFDIQITLQIGEIIEDCFLIMEQSASSGAGENAGINVIAGDHTIGNSSLNIIPGIIGGDPAGVYDKDGAVLFPVMLSTVLTAANNLTIRITDGQPIGMLDAEFTFFYKTAILP